MKEQENKDLNPHRGETLSSFLEEKGSYEKVSLAAIKNVLAWAIQEEMQKQKLTKMAMAEKM
ncbi:MAG: Fis family transcriptional regulator, partial [Bacteroidota bacterium]